MAFALALAVAFTAAPLRDASAAGTLRKNADIRKKRPPQPPPPPPVVLDDSTNAAIRMTTLICDAYGGDDSWNPMQGVRYDVIYTIPGPDNVPVRTWTESHILWVKGAPRVRIDNGADSTVVIVDGDTTWVRRDGVWTSDSTAVATDRASALEARWLTQVPWNLIGAEPKKRRIEQAIGRDTALVVRAEYGPGEGRTPGSIVRVTFAPPSFGLRTVHWFDPRANAWFLLELSDDKTRFGWRWSERRTLYTSDSAGTKGVAVLDARLDDYSVASEMPDEILHPPGRPQ